jgi:hypothetical protein
MNGDDGTTDDDKPSLRLVPVTEPSTPPKSEPERDHLGRVLPGRSLNPGGRSKKQRDIFDRISGHLDAAVAELGMMLLSADFEERKFAVETVLKWGLGTPPKRATTTAQEVPRSDEARLKALESMLMRFALDGDERAMGKALAALSPEKYGPQRPDDAPGDATPPTRVVLVARGEGRPEHLLKKDDP